MNLRRTPLVGVVFVLLLAAPAGVTVFAHGATATATSQSQRVNCAQAGTNATPSFDVGDVTATNASVDGVSRIAANVTNPGDTATTQQIEVRLEGELLTRGAVRVPAKTTKRIAFEANLSPTLFASPNSSDWRFVSVLTCEHGTGTWFYVDNGSAEEADSSSYERAASERKMRPNTPAQSAA